MQHVMKSVGLFFCFMIFVSNSYTQTEEKDNPIVPVDENTGKITYKEVVPVEGTPLELYNRGIEWINKAFKNPASATSVRDPESGKIEGQYRFTIYKEVEENVNMEWGTIMYSFLLEFKDGRYRYTFTDFLLKSTSKFPLERWLDKSDPSYNETCDEKLIKTNNYVQELIAGLKESMKPPKEVKADEW